MKKINKTSLIVLLLLTGLFPLNAQKAYKYRLCLRNKAETTFSLTNPEEFLSKKSILRREKQGLPIDSTDIPVCKSYLEHIRSIGVQIVTTGKWNNTVTIQCEDTLLIPLLLNLPFVCSAEKVWTGEAFPPLPVLPKDSVTNQNTPVGSYYGYAAQQIKIHRGDSLHTLGFRGEGMTIAVLDAGFRNVNCIDGFRETCILGTRDFIEPNADIYLQHAHGLKVLSCLAANTPHVLVGTAPNASYWLLRCEENDTENLVEQDYWAAALEYADSLGVDVVTASLGYYAFDDSTKNYTYDNLDGNYSLISRSAGMAAGKGIVLLTSAGNEGSSNWKRIVVPADAHEVITVGGLKANSTTEIAGFSSCGPTADGRIKPDVVAFGTAYVFNEYGKSNTANGTSFATPLLAGLVACLWQACPDLTAREIIRLVLESGDRFLTPDLYFGYGIPNLLRAYQKAHGINSIPAPAVVDERDSSLRFVYQVSDDTLRIPVSCFNGTNGFQASVYSLQGNKLCGEWMASGEARLSLQSLRKGIYVVSLQGEKEQYIQKLVKDN